ncbi:MAG: hypothetical protein ABI340_02835 [Nitrososphaera sp.]|jgi:hypothetical protein
MGKITFVMDDAVEARLRSSIINKKGNLGIALTKATEDWLNQNLLPSSKNSLRVLNRDSKKTKRRRT